MFGHAAREELATPIAPATAEGLEWLFRQRQQRQQGPSQLPDERFQSASLAYRAPRFRALFRIWQQEGNPPSTRQGRRVRAAREGASGRSLMMQYRTERERSAAEASQPKGELANGSKAHIRRAGGRIGDG